MTKLKRLATKKDGIVSVEIPVSHTEINSRSQDYLLLPPQQFAKKYRSTLFKPVLVHWNNMTYEIQLNSCTDPYCKWFGKPQERFESAKNKPYRYKLTGNPKDNKQRVACNSDPVRPGVGMTWYCTTSTFSNWSATEEITRLVTNDSVQDMDEDYVFHRDECDKSHSSPFDEPKAFYKRGKSSSNSQKWQCKECKKITNVLPERRESFTYNQKKNDILHSFALALVNRTPVKRTCEILEIAPKTYYHKLEWLYRRCLEFLERFETKAFQEKEFKTLWVNTDKLIYNLNNVRRRGQNNSRYDNLEDKQMQTHIVVSSDVHSRYVFRSDIAYDWTVPLNHIESDTKLYKEDHLDEFSRKNARLRFSYAPQQPTEHDTQTMAEYLDELNQFNRRKKYIEGVHVNSTYTTFAQLWLLKHTVKAGEWRFVTDEDSSIMTALFRAFKKEFSIGYAHHYLCKIDRSKSVQTAFKEYQEGREQLRAWATSNGITDSSLSKIAYLMLKEKLKTHQFHESVLIDGKTYPKWAKNPVEHPLPSIDQGWYSVDCTTNLLSYDPKDIANMILQVNDKSASAFMQQIRRRISTLERPLVTARGDGKSYIYANFNPKYAHYAVTILRTFYNFCLPLRSWDKSKQTPAQRLGISNKAFTLKDIIYFK